MGLTRDALGSRYTDGPFDPATDVTLSEVLRLLNDFQQVHDLFLFRCRRLALRWYSTEDEAVRLRAEIDKEMYRLQSMVLLLRYKMMNKSIKDVMCVELDAGVL